MHATDIVRTEALIYSCLVYKSLSRRDECLRLPLCHLARGDYPKPISHHPAARTWFRFGLNAIGAVSPLFGLLPPTHVPEEIDSMTRSDRATVVPNAVVILIMVILNSTCARGAVARPLHQADAG